MTEKKIDHIAYQLRQIKEEKHPGAIVFIGAGCSISAGIPATAKIVEYVLENHKDNPDIKCFDKNPSYADLMACLGPRDRNKIFKHYVENAKINVSHIYLAHLMAKGYVDYIVTVNFDNLAQRALALYNIFPPTYDISILKDLTTTSLDTKSITYLHGQYNGLWQLNTKEEMNRINDSNIAKSIFDKITNNRLWIVVGYSGEDFIFDQLVKLGRFDNGLYWIGYKDNEPSKKVQDELLNKANTESFLVKGYDADTFFLKLNAALQNEEPKIFNTPFSFLSDLQENIIDIEDSEDYKSVKERFIESQRMVKDAINKYEKAEKDGKLMTSEEIEENQLRQLLIECLIKDKYEDILKLEEQVLTKKYNNLFPTVTNVYISWGNALAELAQNKSGEEAEQWFQKAIEKYAKAIQFQPSSYEAFNNWGTALDGLAQIKSGQEAEHLFQKAIEKYVKATELTIDRLEAFVNWGNALRRLAQTKSGGEAEHLLQQAFEKYAKATELQPDDYEAFNDWGNTLAELARSKSGEEAEHLLQQAIEKYAKAIQLQPDNYMAFANWGNALNKLAQTKSSEEAEHLLQQTFEKYAKAIQLKPDAYNVLNNWGVSLAIMARSKSGKEADQLLQQAIEKHIKVTELQPEDYEAFTHWGIALATLARRKSGEEAEQLFRQARKKLAYVKELGKPYYNLACLNALTDNFEEALNLLEKSLQQNEITFDYVEKDSDWVHMRKEATYQTLKQKYLNRIGTT